MRPVPDPVKRPLLLWLSLLGWLCLAAAAPQPPQTSPAANYLPQAGADACLAILQEAFEDASVPGERDASKAFAPDKYLEQVRMCFLRNKVVYANDVWYTAAIYEAAEAGGAVCQEVTRQSENDWQPAAFHNYEAYALHGYSPEQYSWSEFRGLGWCMSAGGYDYYLQVLAQTWDQSVPAPDPQPLAEALLKSALDRLPVSPALGEAFPPVEENPLPDPDTGEATTDLPEGGEEAPLPAVPGLTGDETGTEPGSLFGLPPLVVLGSLGVPLAGAAAGALLATLLGGLSATPISGSSTVPTPARMPPSAPPGYQDLVWSERPWDEAGPGYVTREEYEHTQTMLSQGYRWTQDGWQTPEQAQASQAWDEKNQAAVEQADAQFRDEMSQDNQQALQERDARLLELGLQDFKERLELLDDKLYLEKHYVLNPYQGDPFVLGHRVVTGFNRAYDATLGKWTGKQGLTCQGYVNHARKDVEKILQETIPGAKLDNVIFEEKSTLAQQGFLDWLDSAIDDNHNLMKVTLPDNRKLSIDFHQKRLHNAPLLDEWDVTEKTWRDYLGEHEFTQRVRHPDIRDE